MANDLSLITMLKTKMHWHNTRQKILAENIANSDTPRFIPMDVKALSATAGELPPVQVLRTNARHIQGFAEQGGEFGGTKAERFETAPSGNAVNLETEMTKIAENQMEYQSAISLYQKSLGYLKIAVGKGR
jgi:flagellar basal-body rod protein FlgB